jgi:hypothetical protein
MALTIYINACMRSQGVTQSARHTSSAITRHIYVTLWGDVVRSKSFHAYIYKSAVRLVFCSHNIPFFRPLTLKKILICVWTTTTLHSLHTSAYVFHLLGYYNSWCLFGQCHPLHSTPAAFPCRLSHSCDDNTPLCTPYATLWNSCIQTTRLLLDIPPLGHIRGDCPLSDDLCTCVCLCYASIRAMCVTCAIACMLNRDPPTVLITAWGLNVKAHVFIKPSVCINLFHVCVCPWLLSALKNYCC